MSDSGQSDDRRRPAPAGGPKIRRVEVLVSGEASQLAAVREVGLTGILLATERPIAPGTSVRLAIPLDDGRSAFVNARVIGSGQDGQSEPRYLADAEFDRLPAEVEALITRSGWRATRRHRVSRPVMVCLPDGERPATTMDISQSGARLSLSWRPEIGEVVLIKTSSSTSAGAVLSADVIWVKHIADQWDGPHYEVGVRFHDTCSDLDGTFDLGEFDD